MWPCGIALLVPKRALCKWTRNWGSPCSCSAARWLMHEEVGCIRVGDAAPVWVGFTLQAVIWVPSPSMLPFWHLVLEGGGLDTIHMLQRPAVRKPLLQEDFIPLLRLSPAAAKSAGQHGGNRAAPWHWGHRMAVLLISLLYLSNWLGQSFCLIPSLFWACEAHHMGCKGIK